MIGNIEEIDYPDRIYLEAAEGWHMMGNYQSAAEEISKIGKSSLQHPLVLHLRCRVYWGLRNISESLDATNQFIEQNPQQPFGYIFKAMLLSYQGDNAAAFRLLDAIGTQFPKHTTLLYDLASYAARCALWPRAIHWLTIAITADPWLKQVALANSLFTPVRSEIEAINPQQ